MTRPAGGDPAGSADTPRGAVLGRYRIEKPLGHGGMGEVLLALDTLLHRRVALKRMLPAGADRERLRSAILKEARRASQINDRHIAAIHDVLELDDEVILVMEYVEGVTLRERMTTPLSLEEFWELAVQCVEGMAAAHAHGVIHRDLKPENLMVTREGVVKILDFGIAKRADGSAATTTTSVDSLAGTIAGTPQYMAPEAHLGGVVDERTDMFALGVVFYELLTSARPFEGATYAAVLDRVLNAKPVAVSELNPAVGSGLSEVVSKMLSKDPDARFATPEALMSTLTRVRRENGDATATPARLVSSANVGRTPRMASSAEIARTPGAASFGEIVPTPGTASPRARAGWLVPASYVLGVVVVVGAGIGWAKLAPALPKDRNVAILAPATSKDGDADAFELGVLDILSGRLRRHTDTPGFQMASFTEGLGEEVQSPADARKVLGANLAIVSTIERAPDVYRARLDLMDTARQQLLARRTVEVPAAEPFAFLDRTYRAAADMLRLRPRDQEASPDRGIRGAGTLRFYLQGTGRLRVAHGRDEAQRAVSDLEAACRIEPQSATARAGLAWAQHEFYLATRDTAAQARAEASAREAVLRGPSRPEAHRTLAAVLTVKKQYAEALKEFTRASELDPTDNDTSLKMARTYGRLGQPERERDAYLATIAQRPHCWQPYWWLATWYFRQGHVDQSIHAYREMIRRAPDLSEGYSSLGGALVLRGDYRTAIDTLKRSLDLRPTKNAFENLGTAYFNSGRFQEAVDAYNQSFQFGTASYESWINLGDAYSWLQGRHDDAAGAYSQAIRLGRDEILARSKAGSAADLMIPANLATVFARLGQADSARVYLARAVADSANPMVGYCAAVTHWQLGEKREAMVWLERAVRAGYPVAWLRDSPIFREWRASPQFRALVGERT